MTIGKFIGAATVLALLANDCAFAQELYAPDTMEARVQPCTSCHGLMGKGTNDPYFPRLAGKPSGYLYNQLLAFRGGAAQVSADELPHASILDLFLGIAEQVANLFLQAVSAETQRFRRTVSRHLPHRKVGDLGSAANLRA